MSSSLIREFAANLRLSNHSRLIELTPELLEYAANKSDITAVSHPLGFIYCPLANLSASTNLRLHVWDDPNPTSRDELTNIHDHDWDLWSFVAKGCLTDLWYEQVDSDLVRDFETFHVYTIQYGSSSNLHSPLDETRIDVCALSPQERRSGTSYFIPAGQFHQTLAAEGDPAVTIVLSEKTLERGPRVLSRAAGGLEAVTRDPVDLEEFRELLIKSKVC